MRHEKLMNLFFGNVREYLIVDSHDDSFGAEILAEIPLNTNFSSSLMAFHQGYESLKHRICTTKMAGTAKTY